MVRDKAQKTYYYKSFNDDFIESKNQNYKLKENYKWINNNIFFRLGSKILYFLAKVFGFFYYKFVLHVKIKNKKILKKYKKQGYFLYGNHRNRTFASNARSINPLDNLIIQKLIRKLGKKDYIL